MEYSYNTVPVAVKKKKKKAVCKTEESQKQKECFISMLNNIYLTFKACKIICCFCGHVVKDCVNGNIKHQVLGRNLLRGEKLKCFIS